MKVFIGGVMQGSIEANGMSDQGYRRAIADVLQARWPDLEIIDPHQLHPEGRDYDTDMARRTLEDMLKLAQQSDLVIAYVPVASMGTALEIYLAQRSGVPVIVISPLRYNWVLRSYARRIYADLAELHEAVRQVDEPLELATNGEGAP